MGYTNNYLSYGVQSIEEGTKVFNQFEFYSRDSWSDKYRYQVTKNGVFFAQSDSSQSLLDIVAADNGEDEIVARGQRLVGGN